MSVLGVSPESGFGGLCARLSLERGLGGVFNVVYSRERIQWWVRLVVP